MLLAIGTILDSNKIKTFVILKNGFFFIIRRNAVARLNLNFEKILIISEVALSSKRFSKKLMKIEKDLLSR